MDRAHSWIWLPQRVVAYTLPYLIGFAFTRHIVVLAYPSAILCCFALAHKGQEIIRIAVHEPQVLPGVRAAKRGCAAALSEG